MKSSMWGGEDLKDICSLSLLFIVKCDGPICCQCRPQVRNCTLTESSIWQISSADSMWTYLHVLLEFVLQNLLTYAFSMVNYTACNWSTSATWSHGRSKAHERQLQGAVKLRLVHCCSLCVNIWQSLVNELNYCKRWINTTWKNWSQLNRQGLKPVPAL